MGAMASRSDKILQDDIQTFEASVLLTKRPIMWDDDSSVTAHSALNTLRNAQYHIQSGRGGLRVATASMFICTGRVTSSKVVSFGALAVDITSCGLPMSGVRTGPLRLVGTGKGQCAPVTSTMESVCDVIHCIGASSSSSSVCSLEDTLPSTKRRARASWHAHCKTSHESSCSHQLSCDLEATPVCPFDQDSEEAFGLRDILTSGGRPATSKAHEESLDCAHEIGAHEEFDISAILASGGRCLTHQVTR